MNNNGLLLVLVCLSGLHTTGFSQIESGTINNAEDLLTTTSSVLDKLEQIEEVDPKEWGIRNGCISRSRIRSIRFIDDQSAIVKMMGKKKILLTMRKECHGIAREGFITRVNGNKLCAKFDRFEVIDRGMSCTIESLEPYIEPVTAEDSVDI